MDLTKSRRCIGLDINLAEELKNISRSRGMSIISYLRRLLDEAIDLEKQGYYVPEILHEKKLELILSKLGFVYIPSELLLNIDITKSTKEIEMIGEKIGKALNELNIDVEEVIERIAVKNDVGVVQSSSIILIPVSGVKEIIKHVLIGMAKSIGMNISLMGNTVIIKNRKSSTT